MFWYLFNNTVAQSKFNGYQYVKTKYVNIIILLYIFHIENIYKNMSALVFSLNIHENTTKYEAWSFWALGTIHLLLGGWRKVGGGQKKVNSLRGGAEKQNNPSGWPRKNITGFWRSTFFGSLTSLLYHCLIFSRSLHTHYL